MLTPLTILRLAHSSLATSRMSIPLEIALHCLDRSSAFTANRYNSAGNTEMGPQDAPLYGRQAIYALHQRVKLLPPQGEHNSVLVHNVIMNYTLYKKMAFEFN